MIVIQTNNDNNVDDDDVRKKMENSSLYGNFSFFFVYYCDTYIEEKKWSWSRNAPLFFCFCFFVDTLCVWLIILHSIRHFILSIFFFCILDQWFLYLCDDNIQVIDRTRHHHHHLLSGWHLIRNLEYDRNDNTNIRWMDDTLYTHQMACFIVVVVHAHTHTL